MRPRGPDSVLQITGGRPLRGRVRIGGSKNATLPIMAAALLTREPVTLRNVAGVVPDDLGRRMRASIVLLGPLVARVGLARLPKPGGDQIGARRVEQHVRGLRALGAEIVETPTEFVARAPGGLRGARVVLDMPTVTGTENIIMAAVLADGRTE